MAVSKQTNPREGILAHWRRIFRPTNTGSRASQALRERRPGTGDGPDGPAGEKNPPARPPLIFGVALVAVVTVLSLVAYQFDIPQLFPFLGAGVGAIAGFWLFEEVRRLF